MKLLSLWEPWATLMALGEKRIETRSWDTDYRGLLAIQSAKHWDKDQEVLTYQDPFYESLKRGGIRTKADKFGAQRFVFPHGHITCVVRLLTCWPTEQTEATYPRLMTEQEKAFGNYDDGRWAWVTGSVFRLPEPILFPGPRSLGNVPEDIAMRIVKLLPKEML